MVSRIHFKIIGVGGKEEQDCPQLQSAKAGSRAPGGFLGHFLYY